MKTEDKASPEQKLVQPAAAPSADSVVPDRPRRPWRRRLIVLAILLVGILVFHAAILRSLADLLVVNEPITPTDVVVIGGTSGPYRSIPIDEVTDLYRQGHVREVLLLENRSSRIVQAGIVPPLETIVKRELAKRNVPQKTLTVVAGEYRTVWDMARALRDWLEERPDVHATVLCSEFESRCNARIIRTVLGPKTGQRVHIRALPDKRFGPSNWWHTRQGIVELLGAYITLTHACVFGEPSETPRWNPDHFEKSLQVQPER
jgi:hypothetical protein